MSTSRLMVARLLTGALALVAVGVVGGYWFARHRNDARQAETPPPPGVSATPVRGKPLYWYDPMQPNQHFDKPGKSPFMDMQLLPKYAQGGSESGGIQVTAGTLQNLGLRTGQVERTASVAHLRAVGTVAFDERLLEVVQVRAEGCVVVLHVKTPLERVRQGQPLAEVLVPQWLEGEQQYVALLDTASDASATLRGAARERLLVLGVPEAAVRELTRTRQVHPTTPIYAPSDGVVTELSARQGAAFTGGAALFRINGLKSVWVSAQIPEAQVSQVSVGSSVEVHAVAWPQKTFRGRVLALLPDVDPQTRTLTARVSIENPGAQLAPGMYVSLDFSRIANGPLLTVPTEAVIATGTRSVVIVQRADGSFTVANVRIGPEQDGRTVILSGLSEGERIVLSGQFLIDSEASLNATIARLDGSETGMRP